MTSGGAGRPEMTVCVPTRGRPIRLRWLLNALEEQTLPPESFEVVCVHDDPGSATERLLVEHPLASAGRLRSVCVEPCGPARKRNVAWREARTPTVAFTDDDCRPSPDWLERLLDATRRAPGTVVQGRVEPDPDEAAMIVAAGFHKTIRVEPPEVECRTANIAYPRDLLDSLGGFDERVRTAEDIDLGGRAMESGARIVGAPGALVLHAVEPGGIRARVRRGWANQVLPEIVGRHPVLRRGFPLGLFWKRDHVISLGIVGSTLAARHRRPLLVLALLLLFRRAPRYGHRPRGLGRAAIEAPLHVAVDLSEVVSLALGSVRSRTLFL